MTAQEKYTKHILSFLDERPYIDISIFECTAGISQGTIVLAKYLNRNISKIAIWKIMIELSKMGAKDIHGYSLVYYEDLDCFLAKKQIIPAKSAGESIYKDTYIKKIYTTIDDLLQI